MKNKVMKAVFISILVILASFMVVMKNPNKSDAVSEKNFKNLSFSGSVGGFYLFDHNTGDIWVYVDEGFGSGKSSIKPKYLGKLVEIGQPLK